MNKLALAVPLILLFGCEKPVPLYCETHSDCAEFGLDFCDVNGDYPASEGIGRTCIDDPRDAGPGDDADPNADASTGCIEHSACESGACDKARGSCAETATVVYVNGETGDDEIGCGVKNSPCRSLSFGVLQIAGDRDFLVVEPGTYVDDGILIEDRRVHIVAEGAELYSTEGGASIIVDKGASATIEGITTAGWSFRCNDAVALNLIGITSSDSSNTVTTHYACQLSIEDSTLNGTAGEGVSGSNVVIRRSTIRGFQLGVSVSDAVTLEGSLIVDNSVGGFEYYGVGGLVMRNNVLIGNGHSWMSVRDLDATVEHNTIIRNVSPTDGAALSCSSSGTGTVRLVGNIIYGNTNSDTSVSLGEGCSITYSNVEGGAPGVGNIDVDPKLVAGDYHLQPDSPCVDRVDSEVEHDIDGEARPGDGMNDMGADEVP